ncbi:MAG: aminotransferase class V-fold PLP-dependent enzyme [Algicola sp.]|nr:aminotransferase class V-fold PLP-dependent enzyme [Algicola sp.]
MTTATGHTLLKNIKNSFFGGQGEYKLVTGEVTERAYLDSAASCLMMKPAFEASTQFLEHYSNTHSDTHNSARISNSMYSWAHHKVLDFLGADAKEYTCIFLGSGATAGINRVAQILSQSRPDKPGVLISLMEHHSNDLPHRQYHEFAEHIGCEGEGVELGSVCMEDLDKAFKRHENKIDYLAVTAASNVTGIINPVYDIAKMAHENDALVVIDASQILAHSPITVNSPDGDPAKSLDAIVFSGHKVYAPGSPGALVIRRSLLEKSEPVELGGGMVKTVFKTEYSVSDQFPDREEAGTPNIFGSINLGMALDVMMRIGMDVIAEHEKEMLSLLFAGLKDIDGVTIYGNNCLKAYARTATISFNLADVDHEMLALILNDHFNLAVRNECFCAHPYVREMILLQLWEIDPDLDEVEIEAKKGMVRASFGLNNDIKDVRRLIDAIATIAANKPFYTDQYEMDDQSNYAHKSVKSDWHTYFSPEDTLAALLNTQHQR